MLAWWRKKSNSNRKKEEQKVSITGKKEKSKAKSFDETIMLGSAKNTCSGVRSFSGFESDRILERRGHPLPRPSVCPASSSAQDRRAVSCSTFSISSSGSSDDPMDVGFVGVVGRYSEPTKALKGKISELNSQILQHIAENEHIVSSSPFPEHSKLQAMPTSARNELWAHGSMTPNGSTLCSPRTSIDINFTLISRSLCPGLSGHTHPASPLHPWACGLSPESSSEKQDDGKNRLHPLPLPPGSDSHPLRNNRVNNTTQSLLSIWKKGKLLGRGTFGHVYVGFNSENGQMCAIKEVRVISDDQNSEECLRQLNQEISFLSQLSHPNIVKYHGSELVEDVLSVYLEYVSGGSIHKLLQEYGPFKEAVIQNYTRQILSGLAYLHDRNTLHRDIKGANILVDPNGEIKLADFGIAKHINSCTSVLSFKGSPYWMAPEVIMNCNGCSLAVDIWSLGCTILEMATAKPPWIQYEGVAAIFKIASSEDIPEIPDHISNDGKSFLKLCLQRDPSARPTAAQLLEHPFVRDQPAAKIAKININKDASQDSFHIPKSRDFRRSNFPMCDGDYGMKCADESPMAFRGSRYQASKQVNFSLPVSPCSSPLHFVEPVHKSCSLSPVYMTGIGHHGLVHRSVCPPRNDANLEIRMKRHYPDTAQTADAAPRAKQLMYSSCS